MAFLCSAKNPMCFIWKLGNGSTKINKQSLATVAIRVKCMQFNDLQKSKSARNCKSNDKRQMDPECCKAPCPEMPDRFDDLHYTISDKATRVYQQTWIECPKLRIVPRPVCCYEKLAMASVYPEKRQKAPKKQVECKTAVPQCKASKEFLVCAVKKNTNEKCTRICMPPPCKCGRDPPTCTREKAPKDCIRICTPYPSFSECDNVKPMRMRAIECRCLTLPALCDINQQLQKLNLTRTKY